MEENNNQQLIDMAHGMQEDIKMKMLEMIQQAASPYNILYEVANFLEDVSAERGYAQHIIDNIHTVYGIALKDYTIQHEQIMTLLREGKKKECKVLLYQHIMHTPYPEDLVL